MSADAAIEWTVPDALAGERVDRVVAMETGWSRAEVQAVAAAGGIVVDGRVAAKSLRLAAGQHVVVARRPEASALPGPEAVPLAIRYADDDLFVVAKPAGLVVHPGPGHAHGTLVHGLLALDPAIATVGDPQRPGIVHRLDRDTSGLMVVARTDAAYDGLVAALARRDVGREYVALVWGHPENPRGAIDAPIGRSTSRRTRMAVRREGKDARTAYEVREWFVHPEVARLDCRLETGRTHQIRIHLSEAGHPLLGERVYVRRYPGPILPAPRVMLHAAELGFRHPANERELRFESEPPEDFRERLAALRSTRY
ncbi:MAG: RluA family pseudouridine synthase [Actinomycetota bacterium]